MKYCKGGEGGFHYSREILQSGGLMLGIQQVIATLVVDLQVGDVGGVDGARRLRVCGVCKP